jgi:biotin/methionine sulfoxide reductase
MNTSISKKISLCHWGAFVATIENGRLIAAEPFPGSNASKTMIGAWPKYVYSDLRIQTPMVRQSYLKYGIHAARDKRGIDAFVPVSWDMALDLVASEIQRVQKTYGPQSIFAGSYGWSSAGRFHHARTQIRRFFSAAGGYVDQVGNYSWGAAQFILPHIVGSFDSVSGGATAWSTVVKHSQSVIAFGGLNPKNWHVTSGGAGEHNGSDWIDQATQAGVEFIIISPNRRDAPPDLNALWVSCRPNTDTALMLAMAHEMIIRNSFDRDFINRYCVGFDKFLKYIIGVDDGLPKSAEWAAEITGVTTGTIKKLSRQLTEGRTLLTATWSLQRADHGEQPYWALIALAALSGQIGLPGGGFSFGNGSMNGVGATRRKGLVPSMPSISNLNGMSIPAARVADMLLYPGKKIDFNGSQITYPDTRLVYWAGGNPFHHHQDLNQFETAWRRPETIVVHEPWWTPTARRADIVLPATTTIERNDIGGSARDPYVFAMPKLIEPVGESRSDFEIFGDLARRLNCADLFTDQLDEMEWVNRLFTQMESAAQKQNLECPNFDDFWESGFWHVPSPEIEEVLLQSFRDDPETNALKTPSGRIELYSDVIANFDYSDCPPTPSWIPPKEWLGDASVDTFPIHLLTNQPANQLHSQLGQTSEGRANELNGREPVLINSEDADLRGIEHGDIIRLYNNRGAVLAAAVPTSDVAPSVAIMSTGSWFDPSHDEVDFGTDKRGNANVLTRDQGTSRLSQATSAQSTLIQIEKFTGDIPIITAFDPPEFTETD